VVWGLDLVGPLKRVPRGYMHLLITVDKFTKWIEAAKFFTNIIHCFGVPKPIITDKAHSSRGRNSSYFATTTISGLTRLPWHTPA
jgi:hypothetical protein